MITDTMAYLRSSVATKTSGRKHTLPRYLCISLYVAMEHGTILGTCAKKCTNMLPMYTAECENNVYT